MTAEDSIYLRRNRFIMEEIARVKPITDQKVKTLEAVTVKGRVNRCGKTGREIASGMFSGGDAYTFDLINDPLCCFDDGYLQYLQGKVAGLQIRYRPGSGRRSFPYLEGSSPSLYLNEMQVDARSCSLLLYRMLPW